MLKDDTPTNGSDNVIPLGHFPLPAGHRGINEDVVEILKELLEDAMSGHISSIAVAAVSNDDTIKTRWAGDTSIAVLGFAVAKLKHEYFGACITRP